jgi:hypothetical protein
MATIHTNGTGGGNWANAATWVGGVVPVWPDTAQVEAGDLIDQVPVGQVCDYNYGTVLVCDGLVRFNYLTIILVTVNGIVTLNELTGTITVLAGTVTANDGVVTTAQLGANVITNYGTVASNSGYVLTNAVNGTVTTNEASPGPGIDPGVVVYNFGIVGTNNGAVQYLMRMGALAGGTVIHPGAFEDPSATNVKDGVSYQFNYETLIGTLVPVVGSTDGDSQPYAPGNNGRSLSRHNAGAVIAYNDNFSSPNENVGKKAR